MKHPQTATGSSSSTSTGRFSPRARLARDSILQALETAFGWKATEEHQDRGKWDFSGKTDPQIVRELVIDDIGRERFDTASPRALRALPGGAERGLASPEWSFPSPASRLFLSGSRSNRA